MRWFGTLLTILQLAAPGIGQALTPLVQLQQTELTAQQLVRAVVANELRSKQQDDARWMYTMREDEAGKEEIRRVVQTNEGLIYRSLSRGGHELDTAQQRQEDRRIQEFLRDRKRQEQALRKSRADTEKSLQLLKTLPNAFLIYL